MKTPMTEPTKPIPDDPSLDSRIDQLIAMLKTPEARAALRAFLDRWVNRPDQRPGKI